ncbi:3,4-dihydroxy-2-butanone-4-phosphate synthase [Roseicella sp. DB1501]|uniref:3,4-dihydroxy-2-butanone-4-phosphate synthase n=1 Tax=Roseicella sp. DB1501 TaxID=2730925 RepID=UPI0014924EF8|nr:3,4-dihydroxy-2-butanone-4-phosphate synthase [Roseicella sp. DB1501]NOG71228.1 3,4-dihydroxy-2-butanone-4-phosphate synthase [Roseicella sp. DB1501]
MTAAAAPHRVNFAEFISPTEELIEEARRGRMFILVDDEDRENEGDLVIPAQFATPDAINFMAKHARGLICLAMTRHRVEQLGLPLMAAANGTRHSTAFTVSIEAKEGVTTGISAADRAHTVATAINPELGREHIVTPGHVFPLLARDGGTLVRAGHTEASVDIARLAGLNPSGVICEIMNEDGTMARMPDLVAFAQHHGLKLGTIADLIAHRRRTERLVRRVTEGQIEHQVGGDWRLVVFTNTLEYGEHLALVKGDVAAPGPVHVRMHAANLLHDIVAGIGTADLHDAMRIIDAAGRGVVVIIRDWRPNNMSEQIRLSKNRRVTPPEIRDYGIGAQILTDLGVRDMVRLSNNPRPIVGLEGYGLRVVETRPLTRRKDTE